MMAHGSGATSGWHDVFESGETRFIRLTYNERVAAGLTTHLGDALLGQPLPPLPPESQIEWPTPGALNARDPLDSLHHRLC